jgi:hypothetical protein
MLVNVANLLTHRENLRAVDLNRSFPDHFQNNTKPRQRETQAIQDWLTNNTFVLSASLHGGALVANYPYDNVKENSKFHWYSHFCKDCNKQTTEYSEALLHFTLGSIILASLISVIYLPEI